MTHIHPRPHPRPLAALWLAVGVTMATLAGAGATTAADDQRAGASPSSRGSEMVDEIVAGNIFSAERRRAEPDPAPQPPREPPPPVEPAPPPNPDASLVLVGVVVGDGASYAFIEDRRSGEVQRVRGPGDFAQGEITRIHIDGVEYRVDGTTSTIGMRQTFAGDDADGLARRSTDSPSASPSGSSSGSADRQAILERLRQRRAQQTSSNPASSNRE